MGSAPHLVWIEPREHLPSGAACRQRDGDADDHGERNNDQRSWDWVDRCGCCNRLDSFDCGHGLGDSNRDFGNQSATHTATRRLSVAAQPEGRSRKIHLQGLAG